MTFWEIERIGLQVVFLALFFRIMFDLKRLVQQGQQDRKARESIILELKETALALAKRTAEILAASEARVGAADATLQDIERNTRSTVDELKKNGGH